MCANLALLATVCSRADQAGSSLAVSLGEDVPTTVDGLLAMEDITIAEFFPPRFEQTPPAELAKLLRAER